MKKTLGIFSILTFIIGVIEFIPIPNCPLFLRESIQTIKPVLISGLMVILNLSFFFLFKRRYSLIISIILGVILLSRGAIISKCNYIHYQVNKDKDDKTILFIGMLESRKGQTIIYSWAPIFDSFNNLVYSKNHGRKNDFSSKEIVEIIDEAWFENRIPLFE